MATLWYSAEMADDKKTEYGGSPPYVSAKTLLNFIERLKQGLPTHIDRSLMNGYSGAVMSQLTLAMKFLRLIGNNGDVSERLHDWVNADDEARPEVIRRMIATSYPFLQAGFDLSTATTGTLDQQFREMGVTGDTLRKCASFLVAMAKEANMPISPHIRTMGRGAGVRSATRRLPRKPRVEPVKEPHREEVRSVASSAWAQQVLDKMPGFDPEWSEDTLSKWLDTIQRLTDMQAK